MLLNGFKCEPGVYGTYKSKIQYFSQFKNIVLNKYCAELSPLNFRLHAELKEALEMQLDALPFMPLGTAIPADEEILRNLQEQLQLTNQVCEMKHLYSSVSSVPWQIREG